MKRFTRWTAGLAVLALVVAACGDDAGGGGEDVKVGMAYDVGGRGDKSFNDMAALAFDEKQEEYGFTASELTPDAGGANREENLRLLAEEGNELLIANGFAFNQNVYRVGTEFPDVTIGITDDCPLDEDFAVAEMDNVRCMLFAEEEGSYLMGVIAALKTQVGVVGFIGGVETDLIKKFEAGFYAGVEATDPSITVLPPVYLTQVPDFSGFTDPAKGKEAALALYEQGADIVYHAAGESGLGLFEAVVEANEGSDTMLWAIGVDADQYESVGGDAQCCILSSMIKRVDVHVGQLIDDYINGEFTSGVLRQDLSTGGIDYSTSGGYIDDITDQVDDVKQQIIDGTIDPPASP